MAKPITSVLQTVKGSDGNGLILDELSGQIERAVEAIKSGGKTVKLSLNLTIARSNGNTVGVSGEIIAKLPKPVPSIAVMFTSEDDNDLHQDNPKQRSLELREVSKPKLDIAGEPEKVAAAS